MESARATIVATFSRLRIEVGAVDALARVIWSRLAHCLVRDNHIHRPDSVGKPMAGSRMRGVSSTVGSY